MKTIPVREAVGTILCHDIGNLRDLLAALTIPVLIITHAPEDVDVFAAASR